MNQLIERSSWHSVTISIPFPTSANASLVKQVIEVDKPLRPSEISRILTVSNSILTIKVDAITISQARVALDHCLSDVQLIVETMAKFTPTITTGTRTGEENAGAPSLEVGLKGSWGSVAR